MPEITLTYEQLANTHPKFKALCRNLIRTKQSITLKGEQNDAKALAQFIKAGNFHMQMVWSLEKYADLCLLAFYHQYITLEEYAETNLIQDLR